MSQTPFSYGGIWRRIHGLCNRAWPLFAPQTLARPSLDFSWLLTGKVSANFLVDIRTP